MSKWFEAKLPPQDPKKIISQLDNLLEKIDYRINKSLLVGGRKKLGMAPQPKTLIGGELKDYQKQSLAWMCQLAQHNLNGILADDMGLGKTIQTISYLCYLQEVKKINGKHIIIVPKNVLNNWFREIKRWSQFHTPVILPGTQVQREEVIRTIINKDKFDILIATYQSVQSAQRVLTKFFWETLIIDEAHSIKNDQNCLSSCVRRYRAKFKLLLTGTPLSNQLHQLWSLLNFILPEVFKDGTFFDRIQQCSNNESIDQSQKVKFQIEISKKFQKMLNPFLLRRSKNQLELGLKQKKQITLFVSLTDLQLKMYRNYVKYRSVYGSDSFTHQNNRQVQYRKICGHPYLFSQIQDPNSPPYGEHLIQNSGKMKLLDKLLAKLLKQEHKVLIFSQFTSMLKILEDYLAYRKYQFCCITGESSLNKRQAELKQFQESSVKNIFLISTRAGGIGLNLVAADIVIIYDIDWNPQMDRQAMDRAYRIGQKKSVKVFRFITNSTIQERMLEIQKYKLLWDQLVIQKGGLARLHGSKNGEEKFGKLNYDKIAQAGAEQIFKLQQNFDDQTIEQIIKFGEQKDKEKTKQIREKLQKQFQKFQKQEDIGDIYEINNNQKFDYQAEKVGFLSKTEKVGFPSKANQRKHTQYLTQKILRKFVKPQPYHLFQDTEKAGQLLYQLQNLGSQHQHGRQQIIDELNKIGFYGWTKNQYQKFSAANLKFLKSEYQKIADEVNTKSAHQVQLYSKRFFQISTKSAREIKGVTKIVKKQQQLRLQNQLQQAQHKIRQIPSSMMRVASKYTNNQINYNAVQIAQMNNIRQQGVQYDQIMDVLTKLFPRICKNLQQPTTLRKIKFANKLISQSSHSNSEDVTDYCQDREYLQKQFGLIRKAIMPKKDPKKGKTTTDQMDSDQSAATEVKN